MKGDEDSDGSPPPPPPVKRVRRINALDELRRSRSTSEALMAYADRYRAAVRRVKLTEDDQFIIAQLILAGADVMPRPDG